MSRLTLAAVTDRVRIALTGAPVELAEHYARLVLARGARVTLTEVHDAYWDWYASTGQGGWPVIRSGRDHFNAVRTVAGEIADGQRGGG